MDDKDDNASKRSGSDKNWLFVKGEKARESGHKGGVRSVKSRREKRTMQQDALAFLSLPMHPGKITNPDKIKSMETVIDSNLTIQQQLMLNALAIALQSRKLPDIMQVLQVIRDTSGQKPTDKQETSITMPVDLKIVQKMVDEMGDSPDEMPKDLDDGLSSPQEEGACDGSETT